MKYRVKIEGIVRKGVPAPLFKASTLWPSLPPPLFLKSLFLHSSFLFHPLLRYFRQSSHPHIIKPPPSLIQPTNLPWFRQISKRWFYLSNCCFLLKINFYSLNPFTYRKKNLNLYEVFSGSFLDNFKWLFLWNYYGSIL